MDTSVGALFCCHPVYTPATLCLQGSFYPSLCIYHLSTICLYIIYVLSIYQISINYLSSRILPIIYLSVICHL